MKKKKLKTENNLKDLNQELMDVLEKIKKASEQNKKLSSKELDVLFFASLLEEDN